MSTRLPDRVLASVPDRYRERVPPEIRELWREPGPFRVLLASAVAMFALAIFPPFLSPGARAIQSALKQDPTSLGTVAFVGIALGAGALLFGGALGDAGGHRRWLIAGLCGLVVVSCIGVIWTDDQGLVTVGLLAAFWSGFALPLGIAVLADAYPDRAVQDMAIGIGLSALGVAQIVAPVSMDIIADLLGIGAIYALPIATGGLALFLVWRSVPERVVPPELRRRDVIGQGFAAAVPLVVATLMIVMLPGTVDRVALVGLAAVGLVWSVAALISRRRGRSLLPPGMSTGRMIMVALFVGVFMSFAVNAPLLYFGSFLRVIRDWGEWTAAAGLIPHLIPIVLGGILAPVFISRFGYVRIIVTSMAALAVGCAGFALGSAGSTYLWFIAPMALLGAGMIVGTTARAGLILSGMPTELPGLANALNLAALELGAILGQTVMTVMLLRFASEEYEGRLTAGGFETNDIASVVEEFRVAIGSITPGGSTEIQPQQVEGLLPGFREAMAAGLSVSLWFVTLITIAATVASVLLFRWAEGSLRQGRADA